MAKSTPRIEWNAEFYLSCSREESLDPWIPYTHTHHMVGLQAAVEKWDGQTPVEEYKWFGGVQLKVGLLWDQNGPNVGHLSH